MPCNSMTRIVIAVGGQRHLDALVERRHALTLPIRLVGFAGCHQQPPRWLAHFHATGALDVIGFEVHAERSARAEVALDLAVPASQPRRIGDRRPQVVDVGVVAVPYQLRNCQGTHRKSNGGLASTTEVSIWRSGMSQYILSSSS